MLWRRKTQFFVSSAEKSSSKVKLFSTLSHKKMKKNHVAQKNCFVFKKILRTSRMQLSRPCGTFPPKVRHIFLIGDQNLWNKLLHFSTEMQIFHRIFVCKAKLLLWQLCRNIWSENVDLKVWNFNDGIDEKTYSCSKKSSNYCPGDGKSSFVNNV